MLLEPEEDGLRRIGATTGISTFGLAVPFASNWAGFEKRHTASAFGSPVRRDERPVLAAELRHSRMSAFDPPPPAVTVSSGQSIRSDQVARISNCDCWAHRNVILR